MMSHPLSLSFSFHRPCSLSFSHSLPPFGRKTDRQPPVPHYGLFLERRGEWEDDGKRGGSEEGGKQGRTELFISAVFPLKKTAREQKLAECSRAAEVHRLQTHAPFSTSSHRVERPQRLDE